MHLLCHSELNKFLSWQEIHALIMSLNFTAIEIGCVDSLESWDGGVLVNVYGSAQLKDCNLRRQFVQIVFLAPQENGFFVNNDIFYFIEESVHDPPALCLAQSNLNSESKLNAAASTINQPGKLWFSIRVLLLVS